MTDEFGENCRITDAIMAHWEETRSGRLFPSEEDMNLDKLKDVLDNCYLIQTRDVEKDKDYSYTFLGKAIVEAYGKDLTQLSYRLLTSPQANHLHIVYERIIRNKEPIVDEGEFENMQGKMVKYRQFLVPLGKNDDHVESILGGMRYTIK